MHRAPVQKASQVEAWATSCTMPPLAHPTAKNRNSLNCQNFINMDRIDEALADLRLQEAPNISKTAVKYEVERSELSRHWNGVSKKKDLVYENQRLSQPRSQKLSLSILMILQSVGFLQQTQWSEILQQQLRNDCRELTGLCAG
jgi:hypothetical protein